MAARPVAALGIVSAGVTAQQIVLLQVLGWTHWHHFAYLVVAVALLGYGIAGTVLTLARGSLLRNPDAVVPWLLVITAISMPIGVRLAQWDRLAVDLPLLFFAPANLWRLLALCGLLLPPFLCGGLVTGILLARHASAPGRLYAASLGGAGLGGLAGLALAALVTPPRLAPAVGAMTLLAGGCGWVASTGRQRIALGVAALLVMAALVRPGSLASSQFKPLTRTLQLPDAAIIAERPSLRGWIQVVSAPALRPAPAVSFNYLQEIPPQPVVYVNGLPQGSLPRADALREGGWLDATTDAAAFFIRRPARVLLLDNGPGGWSTLAQHHGASDVTVVEPNRALVALLTSGDPPLAPEWRAPGVTRVTTAPRVFLASKRGPFDVIRLPSVGAFGGTTGLGSAGEQFLLTREALRAARRQLSHDGMLTITAWMDFPERNPLRLLATLADVIDQDGGQPRAHLAAVRNWATVTFLVRSAPWDEPSLSALRRFADERSFDVLLAPDVREDERQRYHRWQNPGFLPVVDQLVDGPREPLYRHHPFQLRPAVDQRPYFSQFLRVSHLGRLRSVFGDRAMPFFELGSLVVAVTFGVLATLAVVCIVLPLARRGWHAGGKGRIVLYFGGLGAGFMLFEIGAMLEAHAWLGSPVLAAAAVITTLLLASGVGSLWSERLQANARTLRRAIGAIAAAIGVSGSVLVAAAGSAQTWPLAARLALFIAIVALPGFALGFAFPLGLRGVSQGRPEHVPWAWAINGCVSVATPAGATLLAMTAGFPAVFVAAVGAYLIAALGTRMDR